jgi:GR25 family glycosyltransferase involved in LPS biosynthesis
MNICYFWINIDTSNYRRIFMEKQFEKLGYNNKRISAITPQKLKDVIIDEPPYNCGNSCCGYNNYNDCPMEYACSSSHLEAIKEGYKSGDDYFIVCEDDIYLPFKIDFEKIIKTLPENWEIFQMMVLDDSANEKLKEAFDEGNHFIQYNPIMKLFSTGMYLINRKGAKKLISIFMDNKTNKFELTPKTIIRQADFLLYMNVNTYTSTFPYCFPNIKFISEIHPNHFYLHQASIRQIYKNLNEWNHNNQFILDYYPFEDFDNFYINYLKENHLLE